MDANTAADATALESAAKQNTPTSGSVTGLHIRDNLKKALGSRASSRSTSSSFSGSGSVTGLHIRDNIKKVTQKVLNKRPSAGEGAGPASAASSVRTRSFSKLKHESVHDAQLNCTRIVYYTFETANPFSRPREVCVFQDHFIDEESGAETVYEMSVDHEALPLPARGHVRSEVTLNAHVARPAAATTADSMARPEQGASVVTSVLMIKLKGSVAGRTISKRAMVSSPAAGFARMNFASTSNAGEGECPFGAIPVEGGSTDSAQEGVVDVGIEDFELMAVVGRGGFGKVMQVLHKASGEVYAMKVLRKRELARRKQVERTKVERSILASVQHPFIVSLRFAFQTEQKLYLVLDFVQGGDFRTLLQAQRKFSARRVQLYTAEMALALDHLHKMGIIYRDLKPENLLLGTDGHTKITDFGLAHLFDDPAAVLLVAGGSSGSGGSGGGSSGGSSGIVANDADAPNGVTRSFCGTEQYMAPEMLLQKGYSKSVDFFSLGIFFCEMLQGYHPYRDAHGNHMRMLQNIVRRDPGLDQTLSSGARSLAKALLQREQHRRLGSGADSMAQIQAHPYFLGLDWQQVMKGGVAPEYVPPVRDAADVRNFDSEFTREAVVDSVAFPSKSSASSKDGGVFSVFNFKAKPAAEEEDDAFPGFSYDASQATDALLMTLR
jgi:serine/threonine protein kinase